MKQTMVLLLLTAIGGVSCIGNAKNSNGENTNKSDTTEVATETVSPQITPEDSICDNPDTRPRYNAKESVSFLIDFLNKNLVYPEEAAEKGLQGAVIVQMVVEKDGTPTNFKVVREVDPLLDEEALRVAKLLPKFIPAQKDGKPVRCIFNFSVPYRL